MTRLRLEVIVTSIDDALAAEEGGADRLELVRELDRGGLTPAVGLVEDILSRVSIPIRVMLRTGESHDPDDRSFTQLVTDARLLGPLPLDGIVVGFLRGGAVDLDRLGIAIEAAGAKRATFHRAFEDVTKPLEGIRDLIGMGRVDRILTSGGEGAARERVARLERLAVAGAPRVAILVGGGVTEADLSAIAASDLLHEVHVGRAAREPATTTGVVSARKVAALVNRLRALGSA
jgi:copper homeostasis protein